MKNLPNTPSLRFPQFSGNWEIKKLGEVAKFSKGKGISKSDIVKDGKIKCIRYGELYTTYGETINEVVSYTNIDSLDLILSEENDVIIPASGETQIDIATASCVLNKGIALGGDLNIIKSANNGVFLSYYLNSSKKNEIANLAQGISVVHLYASQLAILDLNLPTLPEQEKIAGFLTVVDEKLQALKKKKALLEEYKKGIMQRIFSGQLRFKDAHGQPYPDWEVRKLGEVCYKVDRKNKLKEKLPIYSINNQTGFVPQSEQFDGLDSNERGYDISLYKIVEKNTFAYNPARINVGSIGYSGNLSGKVIISSLYVCFKTADYINDNYFNHFLKTQYFNNQVLIKGEGGVRIYLFFENFSEIEINLPCQPEQEKIAEFLGAIDAKIAALQTQLDKTMEWKKGLLQGMFC
jgi:type I restriction enzyme S subunit